MRDARVFFALPAAYCLLPALIAACAAAGPNYKKPDVAQPPAAFKETPPADSTLANAWKAAQPQDTQLRGNWWEIFGDPELNALEERARMANQDVVQAEAQYRAARAAAGAARAELYPTITAGGGVTVTHPSANRSVTVARSSGTGAGAAIAGTGTITDYQIPVDFSWEPDVWGRIRRSVEAGVATSQASAADLEAMRLTIEAELATDYFELHGADAQRDLLDQTVLDYQQSLQITTNRFNQGVAAGSDVEQARGQLDAAQAQATDVEVGRAEFEHAIAVLTGQLPAAVTIQPALISVPPPPVPLGLPSELVERRPDVAAAERRVAAANANIGVAKAAYFPTVSLSASGGLESSTIVNLLTWPSRVWSLGPQLVQTIFDAGRRRALTNQAIANYDATVAAYRQNVLTAFQDVEDSLSDLRYLSDEQQQQDAAVASARNSVVYANNQYLAGVSQYLQVITAQTTLLQDQRTSVELLTRRMTASVALVKALGGGWDVAQLPRD